MHRRGAWLMLIAVGAGAAHAADPDPTLLGAGVRVRPAYEGARDSTIEAVPVVRFYRGPLFVRTTQGIFEGGAQFSVLPGLAIGAQLAYESGRRASESDFLRSRGVPDLSAGASIGPLVEYDFRIGPAPVNLLARYRKHLDADRGAQADLRATVGVFEGHGLTAGVFAQSTWHDTRAARSMFGVSSSIASSSGLPAFDATSGQRAVSFGVLGGYQIARHWTLTGGAEVTRLQGGAAASPLTERRGGTLVSLGLAYRY